MTFYEFSRLNKHTSCTLSCQANDNKKDGANDNKKDGKNNTVQLKTSVLFLFPN